MEKSLVMVGKCLLPRMWLAVVMLFAFSTSYATARGFIYHFSGTVSEIGADGAGLVATAGLNIGSPVQYTFYVDFEKPGFFIRYDGSVEKMKDYPPPGVLGNLFSHYFHAKLLNGNILRDAASERKRPRNGYLDTEDGVIIDDPGFFTGVLEKAGVYFHVSMARINRNFGVGGDTTPLSWGETRGDPAVQMWKIGDQVLGQCNDVDANLQSSAFTAELTLDAIIPVGDFTLLLTSTDAVSPAFQGSGYARMTLNRNGGAVIAGVLPDGEHFSYSDSVIEGPGVTELVLKKTLSYPSVTTPKAMGMLSGTLSFTMESGTSDLSGTFEWSKPQQNKGWYPGAFDTELHVVGSAYTPPSTGTSVLPGFSTGSLRLSVSGTTEVTKLVTLTSTHELVVTNPGADKLKMTLTPSTGVFRGSFYYPVAGGNRKRTDFSGVLFQDQTMGSGFFLGPYGIGQVILAPSP